MHYIAEKIGIAAYAALKSLPMQSGEDKDNSTRRVRAAVLRKMFLQIKPFLSWHLTRVSWPELGL